ncbi:hypothetical protein D0962_03495 [Leptolyngbyaceae cyanobacterium CCMR0082]|uniref:Uncharacterized protein n=2 Tax=Adonisia turfae TaxID=2950184 RepID=A0A6M0S0D4_9CYAN|nr:hypothetical protein [Adonisia turfae]MDV3352375.1 hypothetical protein [Leptothoe sp. LEGE 181152]NEZ58936.1 hypothetical protein [Adonisia turfae CCMR0081]NEZ61846.1 hypothetical protein [Adonisia turfae CCMR0082]
MSIQESARLRIVSNRHAVTNRQRSLLSRAAVDVGMPMDSIGGGSRIQGKPRYDVQHTYGRSNAAMS